MKDKFIFSVCILAIFISGVYATLLFQGASWISILSSSANLATVLGFLLALHVFYIWKSQGEREFKHTHLLKLLKQSHAAQVSFVPIIYYSAKSQEVRFYESMQNLLDFKDNLDVFFKLCGKNIALDENGECEEVVKFHDYILHLRTMTALEREVSGENKTDVEILYLALNSPDSCSSYLSDLNGYVCSTIINFPQIRVELKAVGNAL